MSRLTLLFCLAFVVPTFADIASDQAVIDRLLGQGKFDHAELLCREQLQGDVPIERRAAFTVELLRVLTEKARQSTMVDANKILRSAQTSGESYLKADSESTQRWLVEFQLALLPRLRGDLRQWQMGGVRGDSLHLQYLRDSRKQLQSLATRMDVQLRNSGGKKKSRRSAGLSDKAMRELRARVALELGKTYRAQAEAYPPDSADRSLAAAEGARVLDRVAPTAVTPDSWWRSRMEMMACLRLKSDWAASAKRFEVMLAGRMPAGGKAELRAEAIRIALARKNWSRVKSLVASGVPALDLTKPDLRAAADDMGLAYVEAYLALATRAQQSGDTTAARDYETRAAAAVDARQDASAYWTRRVESLLARGAGSTGGVSLTVRAARGLYRQGKLAEAASAYRRAAEQAILAGDRNEVVSLSMTAAAVLLELKQPAQVEEASRLLRAVSVKNADLPAAADAHLLAIKLVAPRDNVAGNGEVYLELLNEHLRWWPKNTTGKTADQVAWWRGKFHEHAGDHSAAWKDYQSISAEFQNSRPASVAALRMALLASPEKSPLALKQSLDVLRARMQTAEGNADEGWLVLAEGFNRLGRREEAAEAIAQVHSATGIQWLNLLIAAEPDGDATEESRASSAAWRLLLIEKGTTGASELSELSETQQQHWQRLHAVALMDAGTPESNAKAADQVARLLKQLPKDAQLNELNARLLTKSDDLSTALPAWRKVVAGSPPQSRRWYEAKYELAQLHWKQGDSQRASQMIELLRALHPDLGGAEQKKKFLALLNKCR